MPVCLPLNLNTLSSAENKKADLIEPEAHAILIPGSGTYSKKISTPNKEAQQFFDQGLRLAWGFYFPESIASYLEIRESISRAIHISTLLSLNGKNLQNIPN